MRRLLILLAAAVALVLPCSATTYYLDCAVGSSGNGLAWGTAWKALSNITGVVAGDTVYISGSGTCSSYSTSQWAIIGSGSGTIHYQVGQDSGHNSAVSITLSGSPGLVPSAGSTLQGIWIDGNYGNTINMSITGALGAAGSYAFNGVHFSYLTMTGTTIEGTTIQGFQLDHNSITATAGADHFFTSGASAGAIGYTVNSIHDNTIQVSQVNDGSGHGTDGFQWIENVTFYNNIVYSVFNATANGQHLDFIQTAGPYVDVHANYFENAGNYAVYGDLFGSVAHWRIYNNVFTEFTGHGSNIMAFAVGIGFEVSNCCTLDDFVVSNNTIDMANGLNCVGINPGNTGNKATNTDIVNNICYNTGIVSVPGTGGSINVQNNYSGTANINFVNPVAYPGGNFHLATGSTNAVGQGINPAPSYLTSTYTTDKDGNTRSNPWDIGAYDYLVTSITVNLPASTPPICTVTGSTISGTDCKLTVSLTNLANVEAVGYQFDGEPPLIVRSPPYSFSWNPYAYTANGAHSITAVAYDAYESAHQNSPLATSAPVSVTILNNLPQDTCPPDGSVCTTMSVTTGQTAKFVYPSSVAWGGNLVAIQGSGAVSVVGGTYKAKVDTLSSSPKNFAAFTPTTGHLLLVFARVQNNAQTIAITDTLGNSWTPLTVETNSDGFSTQISYAKNITGGSSDTITMTSSGGATVEGFVMEISGASATSPIDLSQQNNSSNSANPSGSNAYSGPYNIAGPAANELVLFGISFGGINTISVGPGGWTGAFTTDQQSGIEWINPPSSGAWYGTYSFTGTVTGDNSGISKIFTILVDGQATTTNANAGATRQIVLDTTQYSNAQHNVVFASTGGNCPSCNDGVWSWIGNWEQQATFSNGSSHSQLIAGFRDYTLCNTPATNCPNTFTQTGSILNSDGTTTADSPTFVSSDITCINVGPSSGVVTLGSSPSPSCSATITGTSTVAPTLTPRVSYVYVMNNANFVPNFNCRTGAILTSYNAANSCYLRTLYQSENFQPVNDSALNYADPYGFGMRLGFNSVQWEIPAITLTEAAWKSAADTDTTNLLGYMSKYGLFCQLQGTSITQSTNNLVDLLYGAGASFVTAPLTYYFGKLDQQCAQFMVTDEVTSKFPGNPLLGTDTGGISISTNAAFPGPVTCTSGTICSAPFTNCSVAANGHFIILGSGDANMDYNTASGAPSPYSKITCNGSTLTWTTPAGVGTHTYCASAGAGCDSVNPNLRIEPWVAWTYNNIVASGPQLTSGTNGCPGGGGSNAGPCPIYEHYDVYKNMINTVLAGSSTQAYSNPSISGTFGFGPSNWCGKIAVGGFKAGNFCIGYYTPGGPYLPQMLQLQDLVSGGSSGQETALRTLAQDRDLTTPMIMESAAGSSDYIFPHGNIYTVGTCVGNRITLDASTPTHNLYNIFPGISRITITGGSGCAGNYYVVASDPKAGTIDVALANASFGNLQSNVGTVSSATASSSPTTITTPAQAILNGDTIRFSGATGNWTPLNTTFTWTVVNGTTGTIPLNSTGFGALTGTVTWTNQRDGTLTWANGDTNAMNFINNHSSSNNSPGAFQSTTMGACPNNWKSHMGMTFTYTGGSQPAINTALSSPAGSGIFMMDNTNVCNNNIQDWRQLPVLSGTGGTLELVRDHLLTDHVGEKWPINSLAGPRYQFMSGFLPLILGAAGDLAYNSQLNPQFFDVTRTGNSPFNGSIGQNHFPNDSNDYDATSAVHGSLNPVGDYGFSLQAMNSHINAYLLASRVIKYAYGQRLPAPDYGEFFEASETHSPAGNLLLVGNFADNTVSQTVSFTSPNNMVIAGQNIFLICAGGQFGFEPLVTINSGTTSHTHSYLPGEACAYMFPNTASSEVQQPTIGLKLSAHPTAASVVVQYSYSQLSFTNPTVHKSTLFWTMDCGTGSTCTLPVDQKIGPVYYRLLYLDINGIRVATSDVQIL